MMGPVEAIGSVLLKPFQFSGRASRAEYWWFFLFDIGLFAAVLAVDIYLLSVSSLMTLVLAPDSMVAAEAAAKLMDPLNFFTVWYALLSFFPRIAVGIRRLHDRGLSGFVHLIVLIPFGQFVFWVLCALPGETDENYHGPPWRPTSLGTSRSTNPTAQDGPMVQGYAALFEIERRESPEFRQAMDERRRAEVRSIYEQRVLGRTSEA